MAREVFDLDAAIAEASGEEGWDVLPVKLGGKEWEFQLPVNGWLLAKFMGARTQREQYAGALELILTTVDPKQKRSFVATVEKLKEAGPGIVDELCTKIITESTARPTPPPEQS
jgi:hypothetical protein